MNMKTKTDTTDPLVSLPVFFFVNCNNFHLFKYNLYVCVISCFVCINMCCNKSANNIEKEKNEMKMKMVAQWAQHNNISIGA